MLVRIGTSLTCLVLSLVCSGQLWSQDPSRVLAMQCLTCGDTCDCYFSSECGDGFCDRSGCSSPDGKFDGVCTIEFEPDTLPAAAIDAVVAWFDAFEETAAGDGGPPNLDQVARAQSAPLSANQHLAVQRIVYNALDRALGFDFVGPQRCPGSARKGELAPNGLGMLRMSRQEAPDGSLQIIGAVREGIVAALEADNPKLIEEPIRVFWRQYPNYRPHHTGRCWDHGHQDYPYRSAEDCQIQEITSLLRPYVTRYTN